MRCSFVLLLVPDFWNPMTRQSKNPNKAAPWWDRPIVRNVMKNDRLIKTERMCFFMGRAVWSRNLSLPKGLRRDGLEIQIFLGPFSSSPGP